MKLFHLTAILIFCLITTFSACGGGGSDDDVTDNNDSVNNDESDDGTTDGTSSDESVYINGSLEGELDASDTEVYGEGQAFVELVTINDVPAGVTMEIMVESSEFEPSSILYWNWDHWDTDTERVAEDDDNNDDSISFIIVAISKAGNYTLAVSSIGVWRGADGMEWGTGHYTVSWYIYTDIEDDFDEFSDDDSSSCLVKGDKTICITPDSDFGGPVWCSEDGSYCV